MRKAVTTIFCICMTIGLIPAAVADNVSDGYDFSMLGDGSRLTIVGPSNDFILVEYDVKNTSPKSQDYEQLRIDTVLTTVDGETVLVNSEKFKHVKQNATIFYNYEIGKSIASQGTLKTVIYPPASSENPLHEFDSDTVVFQTISPEINVNSDGLDLAFKFDTLGGDNNVHFKFSGTYHDCVNVSYNIDGNEEIKVDNYNEWIIFTDESFSQDSILTAHCAIPNNINDYLSYLIPYADAEESIADKFVVFVSDDNSCFIVGCEDPYHKEKLIEVKKDVSFIEGIFIETTFIILMSILGVFTLFSLIWNYANNSYRKYDISEKNSTTPYLDTPYSGGNKN